MLESKTWDYLFPTCYTNTFVEEATVLVVGGGVIPEEDKKALEKSGVTGNFGPGTPLDIIINHITKGVSKLRKL